VRGARLVSAEQVGLDRVLRLDFSGQEGQVSLVCEIMGKHSNLVLIDTLGEVMDALKRIPASLNRYRVTLPRHEYVLPPPQGKADPRSLDAQTLSALLASRTEPLLWQRVVAVTGGVSPIVAREVSFRVTGRLDAPAGAGEKHAEAMARELAALFALPASHAWAPCVARDAPDGPPVAWATYPLSHYRVCEPAPSISAAIEQVLASRAAFDPYAQVRQRLRAMIAEHEARLNARLTSLRSASVSEQEIADLQARGNAVLAMAHDIRPGQRELYVDPLLWYGDAGGEAVIPLDPSLSPSENAQGFFARARKRQAAGEKVPALIAEAERERDYLQQLATDVDLCPDRPALDQVEEALVEVAGAASQPRARSRPAAARQLVIRRPDGATIWVGRNSRENDTVTFHMAAPGDLWFHAHGVAGAHVILRGPGAEPCADAMQHAASLAARYSAARSAEHVQVDYTERRFVRRIPGGRPGMVTYTHERTVVASPGKAIEPGRSG